MSKLSDSKLENCIQSGRQKDDRLPIHSLSNIKDIVTQDSRAIFYQRITCNVLISSRANPFQTFRTLKIYLN